MGNETVRFNKALLFIAIQFVITFSIATFYKPRLGMITDFLVHLAFYILVVTLPVMIAAARIYKSSPIAFLGLKQNTVKGLLYGLFICIFISFIFFAVHKFKVGLGPLTSEKAIMLAGLILAGFLEEIPFRGFYQRVFNERFGFWPANITVSALFALIHLGRALTEGIFQMGMYFVIALWLGYIYEKTKSLWAPILVHACFNLLTALF